MCRKLASSWTNYCSVIVLTSFLQSAAVDLCVASEGDAHIPHNQGTGSQENLADGRVHIERDSATSTAIYISPDTETTLMPFARTPDEVASGVASFIDEHAQVFGVTSADLEPPRAHLAFDDSAWLVNSEQVYQGIRLLGSSLQFMVTKRGKLGWFRSRLFPPSELVRMPLDLAVGEEEAVKVGLGADGTGNLVRAPRLVIAFRSAKPVLAWQFGSTDWLYTIAGDNGEILSIEEQFCTLDVVGDVKARGTDPNSLLPDVSYNPPVTTPFGLSTLTVDIILGAQGSDETGGFGSFVIPGISGDPIIDVRARCVSPDFEIITPQGATVMDIEEHVASQYFTLRLNDLPSEFTTSQVNAFVWMQKSRSFANSLHYARQPFGSPPLQRSLCQPTDLCHESLQRPV